VHEFVEFAMLLLAEHPAAGQARAGEVLFPAGSSTSGISDNIT